MRIYFAGSIRGGRSDAALYRLLIDSLSRFGTVLTEHVGQTSLSEKGDDGPNDRHIYDRDMDWLSSCDLVVSEISVPSLGVGYELGRAVAMGKPVLCLYRRELDRPLSAMIAGNPAIRTAPYASVEEAMEILEIFVREKIPGGRNMRMKSLEI
jgi:nucleoside 2-deoxyribosyltransferase